MRGSRRIDTRRPREGKREDLRDGELILICDIGGGTTDFSLVRARLVNGELQFERTAIGEHLLLGGDNLDFALARRVEEKLNDIKLTLRQRYALRRACCAAKERLLSDPSLERVPVTVLGSGRAVVGQALSVDLTREEVLQILTAGFLPITAPDEMPAHGRPTGLRELGLPYASDPAITKHLAAFLTQAAVAMNGSSANQRMARPDAVLFNGGFCAPAVTRERIVEAISAWFGGAQSGWRPRLLNNEAVDSAVARGAAYYGRVRRGTGLRIRAGNARTYYIALPSEDGSAGHLCFACRGRRGHDASAAEPRILGTGQPPGVVHAVQFAHTARCARRSRCIGRSERASSSSAGDLVALRQENARRVPDCCVSEPVSPRLARSNSGVNRGTRQHRWRLQFELRGEEAQAAATRYGETTTRANTFFGRYDFRCNCRICCATDPAVFLAALADGDAGARDSCQAKWKRRSARRETRGQSRPFAGSAMCSSRLPPDAKSLRAMRCVGSIYPASVCGRGSVRRVMMRASTICEQSRRTSSSLQTICNVRSECWCCCVGSPAASMPASSRHSIESMQSCRSQEESRVNRQLEYEQWRLVASLEHLLASTRALLGNELVAKIKKEPEDAIWLWSLGRLGARIPLYGPLHSVVAAEIAGEWLKALLDLSTFTAATGSAIVLIARRTDDRSRDIDDAIREQAISRLTALGIAEETIQLLSKYVPPERADAVRSFGESLPPGLQVVSSSNCLLSLPAFHSSGPTFSKPA